jgi:uncharacterized transporter YbjL
MDKHNESPLAFSKRVSEGNIQRANIAAARIVRPSQATRVASVIGIAVGAGLLLGGAVGVFAGQTTLGLGSATGGIAAAITGVINLKKNS